MMRKSEEFLQAKIFRSSKRVFDCQIKDTKEMVSATSMRELIKKSHLVVGDNIILQQGATGEYDIVEMLPRQNEIYRRIVRENKKKVIASNIDLILIVASVSKPVYKPFLIDRYLVRSAQWGIPAVIIFNKMDQFDDQFDLEFEKKKFDSINIPYFEISSTDPDNEKLQENINKLKVLLQNKTTICLGQSGVGKSKLISALSDGKIELLSSRLAKKVDKGAHTTTWAEIVDCENFLMIDSPGVRTLSVMDLAQEELPGLFPDLIPYFSQCKFTNCRHEPDSKGCAFTALDTEDPDNIIIFERLFSYLKMRDEVESIPEWKKNK